MNFVLLYGSPGVGKLTVAKELAALTGYRLFDSHASIDVVRRVFDFTDEPFWPVVLRFRFDVFESAARHGVDLITTGAYVHPGDAAIVEQMLGGVETNGGRVLLAQLTCRPEVLESRVRTGHRAANKQTWVDGKDYTTSIPDRDTLRIDNSDLPPDEAARRIVEHYGLLTQGRLENT